MALTVQEEAEYQALRAEVEAAAPRPSFVPRLLKNTANSLWQTPVNMAMGLTGRLIGGERGKAFAASQQESIGEHGFQMAPPQTGGEMTADVGGQIVGSLPTYLSGARLIGGGARGLGASEKAARVIGGIGTGAVSGFSQSNKEAGLQAAEFGAMEGAMALLPPTTRPLLRAAVGGLAGAAVGTGGQVARGHDPTSKQALIQTGVMAAMPFAMEGRGLFRGRQNGATVSPTPADKPQIPADWKHAGSEALPDGGYLNRFETPKGPVEFRSEMPYQAPSEASAPSTGGERAFVEVPAAPPAAHHTLATEAGPRPISISGPVIRDMPGVSSGTPSYQRRRMIAPGSRTAGTIDPALQATIAKGALTAGTYAASDDENKLRNTALVGGALFGSRLLRRTPELRKTMREAASERLAGQEQSKGRAILGSIQRFGEKYMKLDRDTRIDVAGQQGIGVAESLAADAHTAIRDVAKLRGSFTPTQQSIVDMYLRSDRSAGAEALLKTAALPAEAEAGLIEASRVKMELQNVWAQAQSDPKKRKLIGDTLGEWQTMAYRSYVKPKDWKWTKPQFDAVVAENMASPEYAGKSRDFIEKDVRQWLTEVANFEGRFDRVQNEGKSRMSRSAFIKRKELTAGVRDILGEIKDPFEREVLSVAKLASGAATAKTVTELAQMTGSSGLRFSLPVSAWEAELAAARAKGDNAKVSELQQYAAVPDMEGLGVLSKSPTGEGMMAQRGVLDALQAGPGHASNLPSWLDGMAKIVAAVSRVPKGAMTLYNPATHIRNAGQMIFQSISAGVMPWHFVSNLRRLSDNSIYRGSGKTLKQLMREDNIGTAHLGAGEFRRVSENLENLLTPGIMGRIRAVHEMVKSIYGISDKLVRSAAYVKYLDEAAERGMSVAEARRYAVEQTNRYTQNYSGVSEAVNVARNIPGLNPFLSYTAEMLRVMKNLAGDVISTTTPAKRKAESALGLASLVGLGSALKWGIESIWSDDKSKAALEELTPLLPDFSRGRLNASAGSDGSEQRVVNLTPWLPAGDIVATAQNILKGDFDAFLASNPVAGLRSPLISAVTEIASGRDTFTGRENYGAYEKYVRPVQKNMLPPLFPGNYQAEKVRKAFTTNERGRAGITDPQTGRRDTPSEALLSTVGVSVANYSRSRLLKQRTGELDRELTAARNKAQSILRTDVNAEEKATARAALQAEETRLNAKRRMLR